jgi:hypothetical protein
MLPIKKLSKNFTFHELQFLGQFLDLGSDFTEIKFDYTVSMACKN